MPFPYYTGKPITPPTQPVDLPRSRREIQTSPEKYIADDGLVDAVNVALLLGQPLLLTGKPGTGKTQLAYSLAYQLGLGEPLKFETKSTSQACDLFYVYNALERFHAAQSAQLGERNKKKNVDYITYHALGKAILLTHPPDEIKQYLPRNFEKYTKPRRSVVLVDEIDKAPRDFPNDILNEIENLYFRISELDSEKIEATNDMPPILVLTSNSEKPLPEAFLRRCIYYDIPFPDRQRLTEIVEARLGTYIKSSSDFLAKALDIFFQLQDGGLRKKTSTAELLNWLTVLHELYPDTENPLEHPDSISRTLSSLVKMADDQHTARRILNLENATPP